MRSRLLLCLPYVATQLAFGGLDQCRPNVATAAAPAECASAEVCRPTCCATACCTLPDTPTGEPGRSSDASQAGDASNRGCCQICAPGVAEALRSLPDSKPSPAEQSAGPPSQTQTDALGDELVAEIVDRNVSRCYLSAPMLASLCVWLN